MELVGERGTFIFVVLEDDCKEEEIPFAETIGLEAACNAAAACAAACAGEIPPIPRAHNETDKGDQRVNFSRLYVCDTESELSDVALRTRAPKSAIRIGSVAAARISVADSEKVSFGLAFKERRQMTESDIIDEDEDSFTCSDIETLLCVGSSQPYKSVIPISESNVLIDVDPIRLFPEGRGSHSQPSPPEDKEGRKIYDCVDGLFAFIFTAKD